MTLDHHDEAMTKYAGREPYPFKVGDNATGQCSECGLVFLGESAFDYHIRGEYPERGCIDPATDKPSKSGARYWCDNRGRWHYGQPVDPDEYDQHRLAAMERARSARERSAPQSSAALDPSQVSQGTPPKSEGSTGHTAGAA